MSDHKSNSNQQAAMLFDCPDQVGIIAALANYFSQRQLNISRYEEFTDDGQFFSRLEWPLSKRWEDETAFGQEFQSLVEEFGANYSVRFFNRKQTLGIFVSKQPHALIECLNKYEAGFFPELEIQFIVGNDEAMKGIADRHGVAFYYVPTSENISRYEPQQIEIINKYSPDYIGLARYMKVISGDFLDQVTCPIVNIHHSFLPSFVGAKPYQMAYEKGVKLIGATSHFVTAELDQGPIIEQDVARVTAGASVQDMIKMGRDIEQRVFSRALLKVLEHKVIVYKNRTIIFN